mmetsp:Transcript_38843/g.58601  ORF Transcript_38843/g.58601 Transcript_38843/m.58601 type:complete len:213 (+) Transcript_38843:99-737(+)
MSSVVIGISGCTRSGKSTLAKELALHYKGEHLSQDSFFMRPIKIDLPPPHGSMRSAEEPECTNWDRFAGAIQELKKKPGSYVIVEGYQLLHSPQVVEQLDHIFHLDIGQEECIRRRSAPKSEHNCHPIPVWKCRLLVWPAHERYVANSVEALGPRVHRTRGIDGPDDVSRLAMEVLSVVNGAFRDGNVVDGSSRDGNAALSPPRRRWGKKSA